LAARRTGTRTPGSALLRTCSQSSLLIEGDDGTRLTKQQITTALKTLEPAGGDAA